MQTGLSIGPLPVLNYYSLEYNLSNGTVDFKGLDRYSEPPAIQLMGFLKKTKNLPKSKDAIKVYYLHLPAGGSWMQIVSTHPKTGNTIFHLAISVKNDYRIKSIEKQLGRLKGDDATAMAEHYLRQVDNAVAATDLINFKKVPSLWK